MCGLSRAVFGCVYACVYDLRLGESTVVFTLCLRHVYVLCLQSVFTCLGMPEHKLVVFTVVFTRLCLSCVYALFP